MQVVLQIEARVELRGSTQYICLRLRLLQGCTKMDRLQASGSPSAWAVEVKAHASAVDHQVEDSWADPGSTEASICCCGVQPWSPLKSPRRDSKGSRGSLPAEVAGKEAAQQWWKERWTRLPQLAPQSEAARQDLCSCSCSFPTWTSSTHFALPLRPPRRLLARGRNRHASVVVLCPHRPLPYQDPARPAFSPTPLPRWNPWEVEVQCVLAGPDSMGLALLFA